MSKLLQHRSFIRENLIMLIGICLCFYFSYHALQGNRSFLRLYSLEHDISVATADLQKAHTERAAIEDKVKAMRPGHLSRDLLEERVRSVLGYVRRDEMVILPRS